MMSASSAVAGDVQAITDVEVQLAAALHAASQEIAHSECFDQEQRAEVYAILEALQADSVAHREVIAALSQRLLGCANA